MMTFTEFLRALISPRVAPALRPADEYEFDESRRRLHKTLRNTAKEIDAFGGMVRDMRAKPNGKGSHSKPPCDKKRRAKR